MHWSGARPICGLVANGSHLTNETSIGYIVAWTFASCFSGKASSFWYPFQHPFTQKKLPDNRKSCQNLLQSEFTEDDIDETLAMCTAAKDVGITNQCVSQILAAASCENSSESNKLVFSDSRLSTENEGHEQELSEVQDAEKVSEVGDEELLEIVEDELDHHDKDSEVKEHSDVSFDSGPSEEL